MLMHYHFPGNIRELENMIERAVVLEDDPYIQPERLPIRPAVPDVSTHMNAETGTVATLDQVEEAYIRKVFHKTGGKKSETCRLLGISRPTLDRKLEKYAIQATSGDEEAE
jgi:DNA-binding NtrC family response regulator